LTHAHPVDIASLHFRGALLAAQVKLQHFLIILLDHVISHPQITSTDLHLRRQSCIAEIHVLSGKILGSVPLSLPSATTPQDAKPGCWVEGIRLLWPLIAVSWVTNGLPQHREEAELALERIGRQMGIRLALDCKPPVGRFEKWMMDSDGEPGS
jgi:hypothetical protein